MKPIVLLLSCEHAVNFVPESYRTLFIQDKSILNTHRGLDIGALEITQRLASDFSCNYSSNTVTRLLIDCNRSIAHSHCFSKFTQLLSADEKQNLINLYYQPFREKIDESIKKHISAGFQVLHLSIHTFTPTLNGVIRNAGIGLLYDHTRHAEQEVARLWRGILLQQTPTYRVRMNYPYHGNTDSFTTTLRKQYSQCDYLGFEVESNQALLKTTESSDELIQVLSLSLQELLQLL